VGHTYHRKNAAISANRYAAKIAIFDGAFGGSPVSDELVSLSGGH